jgi:Activator of Hsp90 ATPase homolog 1-like protein
MTRFLLDTGAAGDYIHRRRGVYERAREAVTGGHRVGTRFRLIGKPQIGWSGIVDCDVLEAREPSKLRYSWVADGGDVLQLSYRLEPHNGGTRFTFDQTGFKGVGGFLLAKLVMTPVRKKMFGARIPALLDDLDPIPRRRLTEGYVPEQMRAKGNNGETITSSPRE